jgi:carbamate kinase
MQPTVLVAIGGNSLIRPGEPMTLATERERIAQTACQLAQIVADGWRLVVTHGNGPQVGAALRRSELGGADAYPLTLDVCVANTQAEIGVLLQQSLGEVFAAQSIRCPIATILTQVVVSSADPAFSHPNKPVGPFYSATEASIRRQAGWQLDEEPPYGYRRNVPSPEPLEIVEERVIRTLVDAGVVVIALGGGGIPVVRRNGRLESVEAVVDKDLASALLAIDLGVDVLVMATDVDRIYVDFARPDARGLGTVTAGELGQLAAEGQFPAGTMGPKVEAARRFVAAGGSEAIVASSERLAAALSARVEGTHVVGDLRQRDRPAPRRVGHRTGRKLANTIL